MIQTASPIHDLLQAVYSCISDFNFSYAQITKAPREEWASKMDEAFGGLLSHHMEILRCSKLVADTTNTHLYESIVPETFTMAINTSADLHLKAMRNEVFRVMSEQLTAQALEEHHKWDADITLKYSFAEDELRELSYLIPGQNGWVHVCPNSKLEGFLNKHKGEHFSVELQVSDSSAIQYGTYKASIMPGQAMSGLEFAELSQNTRNKVAKSLCVSEKGEQEDSSANFREVMEDLLHSRITLACIFLECTQGPLSPNTSVESLSTHLDIKNEPAPAYLNEDALLPIPDTVPGYFAPRLVHSEPNLSESENEIDVVDGILLDFSSISSRKLRTRRGSSPPPFGVIGDLRRPAGFFATSTPNVSDGVDDEDDYYEDDEDYDDDDEEVSPIDVARTPIAVSFGYTTASDSQETSSSFSEGELSYGGGRNITEPLRPIYPNGRISKKHYLRLNTSFPGLPARNSDFGSDESSFNKNKSESHVNINYDNTKDITDEEVSKDFSFMKIVEDENSFVRPSSALASILSGGKCKGAGEDTSLLVPDSPIWNSCRLRKMISAPAMPRLANIETLNERLNQSLRLS